MDYDIIGGPLLPGAAAGIEKSDLQKGERRKHSNSSLFISIEFAKSNEIEK